MEKQRLLYLLSAYAAGRLTEPEKQELVQFSFDPTQSEAFEEQLAEWIQETPPEEIKDKTEWSALLNAVLALDRKMPETEVPTGTPEILTANGLRINDKTTPLTMGRFRKWGWIAASLFLLMGAGSYWWLKNKNNTTPASGVVSSLSEIPPGRDGAILTLANGTTILLDTLSGGFIAQQNGTRVLLNEGQLAYYPSENAGGEMTYNLLSTPKGRQFRIVLADGTRVWLNAASSIRFPTLFTGTQREVEITGEAYLEVAENATKPFLVKGGDAIVKVLGTSFNINAYDDEEQIKITLLEGSVRISHPASAQASQLAPGQQLQIDRNGSVKLLRDANTDGAISWKNGFFNFQNATLKEVMRQLSRWYNIDIVYEKSIPDIEFVGKMDRNVTLPGLLKSLEGFGVHFRMEEDRKLIVIP